MLGSSPKNKRFGQSKMKYGLAAIDIFSKKLMVVPITTPSSTQTSKALGSIIKDLGHPITVHTDLGPEFCRTLGSGSSTTI